MWFFSVAMPRSRPARSTDLPCHCNGVTESEGAKPKGWVPQWLRERLPEAVGGTPASKETEELTLDSAYMAAAACCMPKFFSRLCD